MKALILLASRPESVGIAVEKLRPERMGIISSQEVLEAIVLRCVELKGSGVKFTYRLVDSPMEISDAFGHFERLLSELEGEGYGRDEILLDATGGTTPMRLGAALAAMTRGVGMVHQRVPQRYVDGDWVRDESQGVEVVPMENPLEATGLLREGQAVELFNRRDYAAAALVFEDIVGKVSGVERGHYYRGLLCSSRRGTPPGTSRTTPARWSGCGRRGRSSGRALRTRSSPKGRESLQGGSRRTCPFLGRCGAGSPWRTSWTCWRTPGGASWTRAATTTAWPGSTAAWRCITSGGSCTVTG
ncbi:hypothetical protein [Rubrobacter xylanophilus]|uniref:hypothetical protein n=1 Tax=Rubrobacter xylanophilus TaxID=49319 RepID=UPI00059CCB12